VRHRFAVGAAATTLTLLLAACGSTSKTATTAPAAPSTAAPSAPVAATSATPSSAASGGVMIATKQAKLGTILAAGPKKMTVYLFEGDKSSVSACAGPCAQVWPPVRTSGAASVGGGAMAADLGTIKRADGSTQVTYKGHPLYFFARDGDKGDAYGQGVKGFGASWYVLSPSGSKVDKS
jgi:predicted lipoprotein with Yx(FWY)xxD motif